MVFEVNSLSGSRQKQVSSLQSSSPKSFKAPKVKSQNSFRGKVLVVVESPAKAKTIKKYLGAGYVVKASVGHIKDLAKSLKVEQLVIVATSAVREAPNGRDF